MSHLRSVSVLVAVCILAVVGASEGRARSEAGDPLYRTMQTIHFGPKRYRKHWNFWVRIDGKVNSNTARIWRDFDKPSPELDRVLRDVGAPRGPVRTEADLWHRIGLVWNWWKQKVRTDNAAYRDITTVPESWPSPDDYGRYYGRHGKLVCAACFSKAHLFATVLGRIVYPRERIALAYAHHTQAGAPKTASHVYVAVYVAGTWYYIDPTHAPNLPFPAFAERRSLGPVRPTSIDYTRPFQITPVPGSGLAHVPYLGSD